MDLRRGGVGIRIVSVCLFSSGCDCGCGDGVKPGGIDMEAKSRSASAILTPKSQLTSLYLAAYKTARLKFGLADVIAGILQQQEELCQ